MATAISNNNFQIALDGRSTEEKDVLTNENVNENCNVEAANIENVDLDNSKDAADDFLGEGDSDEDDFVVTIGEIKSNVSFQQKQQANVQLGGSVGGTAGKLEIDGNPAYKGTTIYDLDLATMEDKPWRKPGADITDYFNYGFSEDTWNQYCERQKKLRSEYGNNQEAINRSIFSSINLQTSPQLTMNTGGRQLVNIVTATEKPKLSKVIIDLSKPPPNVQENTHSPIVRTVITGNGSVSHNLSSNDLQQKVSTSLLPTSSNLISLGDSLDVSTSQPIATIGTQSSANNLVNLSQDFSKPPPTSDFSKPPPTGLNVNSVSSQQQQIPQNNTLLPPITNAPLSKPTQITAPLPGMPISTMHMKNDCPPGVDEPEPPGVSTPPPGISTIGSINRYNTSSLGGFNPTIPPPGVGGAAGHLSSVPPMNVPPPSIYSTQQYPPGVNSGSAGFGPPTSFSNRPLPLMSTRNSDNYGGVVPPGMESTGRGGGRGDYSRDRDYKDYKDYSSDDSAEESYRRKRRRRSRSVSVDRSRRRKDDRDRDSYSSRRHDVDSSSRSSKRKSERDKEKNTSEKKRNRENDERESADLNTAGGEEREKKRKKHEREKTEKADKEK